MPSACIPDRDLDVLAIVVYVVGMAKCTKCGGTRKATSFDGFDLFEDDGVDAPSDPKRDAYAALKRGDIVKVGGKKFRVFQTQGVVKLVVVHGSKGRKFYEMRPEGHEDPFQVAVFESNGLGEDHSA